MKTFLDGESTLFACRQIHLYLDQNKQKGGGKAGVSREQTSHYCQLLRNTEKQPMSSKHKKLEISPGTDYTLKSFPHAEQTQSEKRALGNLVKHWQKWRTRVICARLVNLPSSLGSPYLKLIDSDPTI